MDRLTDRHTHRQTETDSNFTDLFQPEDEVCRLLSYIKDYRPHLVTESSGRYLLLVRI